MLDVYFRVAKEGGGGGGVGLSDFNEGSGHHN